MFSKYILENQNFCFANLARACEFEEFINGKQNAVIVSRNGSLAPIVRTTTVHIMPSQDMSVLHHELIENIKVAAAEPIEFNNGEIEIYDSRHKRMGFHSDQALDLAEDSYICIFSCYENDDGENLKKLVVKEKSTGSISEIVLDNFSVVVFSVDTNRKFLHKIVGGPNGKSNRWLGVTLRKSKTFIDFGDRPRFVTNRRLLTRATEEEAEDLYIHKRLENIQDDYVYPEIHYTLSAH